ncbi:hypothetical protein X797_005413 [Metarhizium robertsii]|uniref:DNA replication initiation factor cdc45 n=2 Tax=Metarhizium robertsii TaxID=568076 RepID=E9ERX1_METRA|nr:DNA replication initiation factor cdc45 [Metarhizium robertsii ARSEF 23]EFZ01488.1 DNA replication initiation factor cdc45 [Metarhizium robertsii ARSEF 23]EXV01317.1 hypothetical protein X797_005413 [Metarhizium robertsii]
MGISHLYTTLRPLATWAALEDEAVVIDGPALAYHSLHICRAGGIRQPSYALLNRVTISWLESLCRHNVLIRKLYFDGFLPRAKLQVRMGRMMRATTRLNRLYVSHLQGCPVSYLASDDIEADVDIYKSGGTDVCPLTDPCFLVPAVLNCLRESTQYRKITEVVPGEADHFCAANVSKYGGVLITSDSDLLVHNLGEGQVAFFRDLHAESGHCFKFLSFAPRQIFDKVGLAYPEKAIQLAYERKMAPQATLSRLIDICSKPAPLSADYIEFVENYTTSEEVVRLQKVGLEVLNLNDLDPRVSELVLEFYSRRSGMSMNSSIRMFLPPLTECPGLRSAWDKSTPIRQLAYSIGSHILPRKDGCLQVREFRRVESISHAGRQSVARLISSVMVLNFGFFLAMALDKMESTRKGEETLTETIDKYFVGLTAKSGDTSVAWGIVHVAAQMQGTLYSLRVLQQTLRSVFSPEIDEALPEVTGLYTMLSELIPVELYPCTTDLLRIARELQKSRSLYALDAFLTKKFCGNESPDNEGEEIESTLTDDSESALSAKSGTNTNNDENNPFSVLSLEG